MPIHFLFLEIMLVFHNIIDMLDFYQDANGYHISAY